MIIPPQRITVNPNVLQDLERLLSSGQLSFDKNVKRFEDEWARYCGRKYCVTTNSCTSALEIAIRAMDIPKDKRIVVPTNTYGATVQACWNAGYTVELVDIEPDMNMDITKIDWGDDIGLILPVFIGGNVPLRTQELCERAYDNDIPMLADSAHAHGVKDATNYSDITCFSFYATKLMTTFGEGGCLVTDDEDIAEFARQYRHHGRTGEGMFWTHRGPGANMCMTEAQAVVGLSQLTELDRFLANRRKIASIYNQEFEPVFENGNYYKYLVKGTPSIRKKGITLASPVYPTPIHKHPFWRGNKRYPVADHECPNHFCLPIYNDMTPEEANYVMDNVEVVK